MSAAERRLSDAGLALLKRLEGRVLDDAGRHVVYRDEAGNPTIGYGHLILPGESFPEAGLDEAQAEALLRADVARAEGVVHALAPATAAHQFDALAIFAFNIGARAFRTCTALKRLRHGDATGAAEAMGWWNKVTDPATGLKRVSPGLMNRRAAEIALFLGPSTSSGRGGAEAV